MASKIVDALSHPNQRNKIDGRRSDDSSSRWLVQKRTYFKGSYDRVLSISQVSIETQMPNLQGTNTYILYPDFNIKSLTFERDCIVLQARPDAKRNVEKTTIHTAHLSDLASSLYDTFALNAKGVSKSKDTAIRIVDTCFPAAKLKKGKWYPCTLRITNTAIERLDHMLAVQWRMRFTDMRTPGIVSLSDACAQGKTFKLSGHGDRGHRIFASPDRDKLITLMISTASQCVGVNLTVQAADGSAHQHEEAWRGANLERSMSRSQTPLHEFWVSRIKAAETFWTAGTAPPGAEDGIGRFSDFPRRPRLLSLGESTLTEKGPDGKYVSRQRDLQTVAALVVFEWACESRYFAIEWTDRSMPSLFETNRRSRDVALLLEQAQVASGLCVPVLPDFTSLGRKIIGRYHYPRPSMCPAQRTDADLESNLFEQLQNAAGAVHDEVCRQRIIAYEEALANAPVVVPLGPEGPAAPQIGTDLPEMPALRPVDLENFKLEEVIEDSAVAARVYMERAKVLSSQMAANAKVQATRIGTNLKDNISAAKTAVENSETLKRVGKALQEAVAPTGEVHIPEKHAFLVERLSEFNSTVPYIGFSSAFLDAMNRPGRFDRDARRKAYITLETVFCLLPEPKKEGERRLRPEVKHSMILITALQALTRLASCVQLQEEMCSLKMFGCVFSLLDCGVDRVSMEAARLLTRLWAPAAFRSGAKPFVNKSTGEEYCFCNPEDALQVKANKGLCFEAPLRASHVGSLVDGLMQSNRHELLCMALIEAASALVAEPESYTTPDVVQSMVKERLSACGAHLFRLMATPVPRISEGVMAIVRETLRISPEASRPIRDAALDEGIILKHLLLALKPVRQPEGSDAGKSAMAIKITASREFVQRLVEHHPPTQELLQRIFPATLLSLLRTPTGPNGAPPAKPNWAAFWRVTCLETHCLAGLVWDENTRYELRMRLESEVQALNTVRQAGKQPVWNHREFAITYKPPPNVLTVGGVHVNYLLGNPNDPAAIEALQDPRGFFDKLYYHFVFALAGIKPSVGDNGALMDRSGEKELCVRAMAAVYSAHAHHIGPLKCLPYLLTVVDETPVASLREHLLQLLLALVSPSAAKAAPPAAAKVAAAAGSPGAPAAPAAAGPEARVQAAAAAVSNAVELMQAGAVGLLVEMAAMVHLQSSAYSGTHKGQALLMAHSQADVDAVESWWYYPEEVPPVEGQCEEDEPPGKEEGYCQGPTSCKAILENVRSGELHPHTHIWAAGMEAPTPLSSVRQFRWLLASGAVATNWISVARVCLDTLLSVVQVSPLPKDPCGPLVPQPRVIELLSGGRTLAHIAQLLLSNDPDIVRAASKLLLAVARVNDRALHHLYTTGMFFFAMAYVGRDLDFIAELLQATHNEQYFQGAQDVAARATLPIGERSVLGPMLPESLLYQLEAYGPVAFAKQMTRQVDDPEVLWSQAMREEELQPAVFAHLGAFPLRLRDHVLARYEYQPIAPMTYKVLRGEVWCHRYYLRKLCSPEHQNHPIVDHMRFRNELVAEIRRELAREAEDFSSKDALKTMDLKPSAVEGLGAEEVIDVLKKAYKRQALKLHPDKNPDGPEPFLHMQAAYRLLLALAQGELEEGGGPRAHRLTLLLQALCLLHRRAPDIVGEFTFPAYDCVLMMLQQSAADGIEHEHVELCLQLIWLTLNACPENAPFLGDKGAVPILLGLLTQGLRALPPGSGPGHQAAVLTMLSLRALALVLQSEEARQVAQDAAGEVREAMLADLLAATQLVAASNVAAAALEAVAAAVLNVPLRQAFVQRGAIAHVVTRMLQYDATEVVEERINVSSLRGTDDSELTPKQRAAMEALGCAAQDNAIALKGAAVLRTLCGLADPGGPPDAAPPLVETAAEGGSAAASTASQLSTVLILEAIAALLTPYPYLLLTKGDLEAMLAILSGEACTPLVIWSPAMRKQLVSLMDGQLHGEEVTAGQLQELSKFVYDDVKGELVIRDVYVRVYSENPTFAEFGDRATGLFFGLFEFLHQAVRGPTTAGTSIYHPAAICTFEGNPPTRAQQHLCEHVSIAFRAAQALVDAPSYAPAVTPEIRHPVVIAPLVCWIKKPSVLALEGVYGEGGDHDGGPAFDLCCTAAETGLQLVECGTRITSVKEMLNGSAGEPAEAVCTPLMHALLCTVHQPATASALDSALRVVTTLLEAPEPARVTLEDGGYILLLDVIFSRPASTATTTEREDSLRSRARTLSALHPLLTQRTVYRERVEHALTQLLPVALVAAFKLSVNMELAMIRDSVDSAVDTPELVWTGEMHERTSTALGALAREVRAAMRTGSPWRWAPEDAIVHPELQFDLYVGGVYLRRYLDTSKASSSQELRDPHAFMDGLMSELRRGMDTVTERKGSMAAAAAPAVAAVESGASDGEDGTVSESELLLMLARAVELVLGRYPSAATHAAQQGYVEWLVARVPAFGTTPELQSLGGCALRVLLQLALSPSSAQRLANPTPPLVPAMVQCTKWGLAAAIFALDILRCALHDANPDRDELVNQAITYNVVPQLLGLLEPNAGAPDDMVPPGFVARAGEGADMHAKADSDYVRNLTVEIINKLTDSVEHHEKVSEILQQYKGIWNKHQRHSGVISSTANAAGRPTSVANLIRGPTSATSFALPAPPQKHTKFLLTSSAAPTPARDPTPPPPTVKSAAADPISVDTGASQAPPQAPTVRPPAAPTPLAGPPMRKPAPAAPAQPPAAQTSAQTPVRAPVTPLVPPPPSAAAPNPSAAAGLRPMRPAHAAPAPMGRPGASTPQRPPSSGAAAAAPADVFDPFAAPAPAPPGTLSSVFAAQAALRPGVADPLAGASAAPPAAIQTSTGGGGGTFSSTGGAQRHGSQGNMATDAFDPFGDLLSAPVGGGVGAAAGGASSPGDSSAVDVYTFAPSPRPSQQGGGNGPQGKQNTQQSSSFDPLA